MRNVASIVRRSSALLSVALAISCAAAAENARPFLSPVFGENMVLQRGKPNTFWGWAQPGETITVEIAGKSAQARAGDDGAWRVSLDVPPPGGPFVLTVRAPQRVVELRNVLVGDVWLCGGQSNMEFALRNATGGEAEAKSADVPELRLFVVQRRVAYAPAAAPKGEWKVCTPETAANFSAVAYFFARTVQREIHVPIGLVESCLGGSPAESWMSAGSLSAFNEFGPQLAEIGRLNAEGGEQTGSFLMHWLARYDVGGKGDAWAKPDFDDAAWKTVSIPGGFAELGVPETPSVCWFRREIVLPETLPAGAAKIFLGSIEKMDTAYINGRWVGASSWVENPRAYTIPNGALQPGRNVVAVRVFKLKPTGGFLSAAETLRVQLGDGTAIPLAGNWKGALSVDARPPHPLPLDWENYPTMPSVLGNGMIAPLAPLAITGALWYQGEANFTRAAQYRKLLPALVADWRATFRQGDFPFYIAELPRFMKRRAQPGSDGWAEVRDVQQETARLVPHVGVAVTIDTGDADDIHPKEKKTVGERLARCALAQHYGMAIADRGPTVRAVERMSGALKISFDHADGGLVVRGAKPAEFSIAGEDRVWRWADARVEGDVVIVSASDVSVPVAVRYAWQANPEATLFNRDGLPAAPFRTDDWPLSGEKRN